MRIQLSIRDLLLTIAIIALAAGWWIDHQRINSLAVQKWEYKDAQFYGGASLNNEGDKGWEVCGVYFNQPANLPIVILKRPIR